MCARVCCISNLEQCLARRKLSTNGSQYCSCVDPVVTSYATCHHFPLFVLPITWLYRLLILQTNFGTNYQISVKQRQWKLSYNFVMCLPIHIGLAHFLSGWFLVILDLNLELDFRLEFRIRVFSYFFIPFINWLLEELLILVGWSCIWQLLCAFVLVLTSFLVYLSVN